MSEMIELLTDISNRLSAELTPEESWEATVDVAHMIGAKAVNVAAVTVESRDVIWVRSSMEPAWLAEYTSLNFHEVDPVLHGLLRGKVPELHPAGVPLPSMLPDPRSALLRDRLLAHGYNWFLTHMWRDGAVDKGVVFAMDKDPSDMFGDGTFVFFRTVSALISARLKPPENSPPFVGGHSGYRALTTREKDVLGHLARGLSNVQISHTLEIAEVTVRLHLRNARDKMGADTREQTLALAIARGALAI